MNTATVYAVEVPNRSANGLVNVLRDVVPAEVTAALQHLRRFAKPEFLPAYLRSPSGGEEVLDSGPLVMHSTRDSKSTSSHLLVCPTSTITLSALETRFEEARELFLPLVPVIREINVPVFAPTSAAQAAKWSNKYWPTIYKNTNPYGPHPSLVRHAELEMLAGGEADQYIETARRIGKDGTIICGLDIGAVIVERVGPTKKTHIVAVARDARFHTRSSPSNELSGDINNSNIAGNAMGHAVLRAIAMIAQKRRHLAQLSEPATTRDKNGNSELTSFDVEDDAFVSLPLTELENNYLAKTDNLQPDGYLCLDLEIYLTHEPCVMCAMAILHSRFSRVVFDQAMPRSGALKAEIDSLGHGLFWRDQLNWKFLTWQWTADAGEAAERQESLSDFNA